MFASPLRRWSYGVVLYEIFTIGNFLWNLLTLWCFYNQIVLLNYSKLSYKINQSNLFGWTKRFDPFYVNPFFAKWNRRHSVEVCSKEQYDSQVILFQAVRLIHEWMEEKLQTYSSRDTECLNHNTWMINCKLIFLFSAWSEPKESWEAMLHKMVVLMQIYQFQVPDHDELLAKWPRCETNIHWFKKSAERHENLAQGETCNEHDNLWLSFHVSENESLAACSLQISYD